jgi:hypothetical protein
VNGTINLSVLIDGLGHRFVGRQPREPRVRRPGAPPEFAPPVLKLHDRYLQVMRKFPRRGGVGQRGRAQFAKAREEMIAHALKQGWTVTEVLDALAEAYSRSGAAE